MTFPIIPASTVSGSYQISRSLRFRSSASAYLSRTPASAGNRQTWTWSAWVKRGAISQRVGLFGQRASDTPGLDIEIQADNTLLIGSSGDSGAFTVITNAVLRDPSAWYHIVVSVNTTLSSNRCVVYINGVSQSLSTNTTSLNYNSGINTTNQHEIGRLGATVLSPFDGYLAEVNFIDGQALTPSSFGAFDTNGVWQPAKYTGSYGTNGFYLNFSDNSGATATTIGKDSSGNSNNWTPSGISVATGPTYDSMIDSPTNYADGGNGRGNYCTWNPVYKNATVAATDGNLSANSGATSSTHRMIFGTLGFTTASYFEITTSGGSTTMVSIVGAGQATTGTADGVYVGSFSKSFGLGYATNAASWYSTGATNANGAATNLVDGTWGFAVDPANGKAWVRNTSGSWIGGGDPAAGTLPTFTWTSDGLPWFPVMSFYNIATTFVGILNAGQRSYAFTAPSGFLALNTQNLPTPTIAAGNKHFDVLPYQGNATLTTRTGLNLSSAPGLVWVKSRSYGDNHVIEDSLRGTGLVFTAINNTSTEGATGGGWIQNLSATGFSTDVNSQINTNLATYVSWVWAGGGSPITGTGTGGITNVQYSANVSAGFSIVKWTGSGAAGTVTHGLGATPTFMIIKERNVARSWPVWHSSIPNMQTSYIYLDTTSAVGTGYGGFWNSLAPNSSIINLGSDPTTNESAKDFICYAFAAIAGYSAFGSYTGNGSADGPFIYTGFRPRWVMIKKTSAVDDWVILDTSRNTYNVVTNWLFPNLSNAELTAATSPDVLSNGFKLRSTSGGTNASGATFIYAAFAENPFKISRAR